MVKVEGQKCGTGKKAPSSERGKKTVQGACGVRDEGKRTRKKRAENEKQCSGCWEKEIKYNDIYV